MNDPQAQKRTMTVKYAHVQARKDNNATKINIAATTIYLIYYMKTFNLCFISKFPTKHI